MTEPINLADLPPPDLVKPIDTEARLDGIKAHLLGLNPSIAKTLEDESEPIVMSLEAIAFEREMITNSGNEDGRQVLLAFASGSNLDHLGALQGVARQIIDPGDPDANPPIPPTYEDDDAFRAAIQQAPAAQSVAGPRQAYIFHGLRADPKVKDISAEDPSPSVVDITVLSTDENGVPDADLLSRVETALNADNRRPLGIQVNFRPAQIIDYAIEATLRVGTGPDAGNVRDLAIEAVEDYAENQHRLGGQVRRSAIIAALHQPGVLDVTLISPATDIIADTQSAPFQSDPIITVT